MRFTSFQSLFALACIASALPLQAATDDAAAALAIHGQITYVEQRTDAFSSPYAGPNSLTPDIARQTADVTLYLGARLWHGAELWLDPELDQGFGLDDTLGVAGFPSGEAYKVGSKHPYFRLPRAFVRQTVDRGGATESIDDGANQFGGTRSADRWVFTFGKYGVPDLFDVSEYAHDPRSDFLNWAAVDAGSFDYAADAWGFTFGASAEWYHGPWTLRGGLFDLSDVPNSARIDAGLHQTQRIGEIEHRHEIAGRPGKVLLTAFQSHGRMGRLDDAVALAAQTHTAVDVAAVRRFRTRDGISLLVEQRVTPDLGAFARLGTADGSLETYEFTEIDRALELGLSMKGTKWQRPGDTVGLAAMENRISRARQRYLDAGGLGILIGDGTLPHRGPERIVEAFYSLEAVKQVFVSADFQRIANPAYNRDRGPVSVLALRVHAQF